MCVCHDYRNISTFIVQQIAWQEQDKKKINLIQEKE